MTEQELSQLYWLNRETERLQKDLKELEQMTSYRASILTGMPKSSCKKEVADYIAEIADLKEIISLNLQKLQRERARLERYIGGVEDAEIRLIMRLRHINGMTWEDIGAEINLDRRTVSRKYNAFLKICPQCP